MFKRPSKLLLCFLLFFPIIQALLYFVLMADWNTAIQQGTYLATKIIMLVFPLVYMLKVAKEPFLVRKFNSRGLVEGSSFGFGILVTTCLLYYLWLKPIDFIGPDTSVGKAISDRISNFGLVTPLRFILFGCFVSLIHSGLEEYYWRWFTLGQLSRVFSKYAACVISGLGFMLHHIVILGVYFGFTHPASYIFSFGVAIGGMYWAWLYIRKDSIYAPWLSHAWIDLAIFIIGYDVIFT